MRAPIMSDKQINTINNMGMVRGKIQWATKTITPIKAKPETSSEKSALPQYTANNDLSRETFLISRFPAPAPANGAAMAISATVPTNAPYSREPRARAIKTK